MEGDIYIYIYIYIYIAIWMELQVRHLFVWHLIVPLLDIFACGMFKVSM